jgi:hypothetical protein
MQRRVDDQLAFKTRPVCLVRVENSEKRRILDVEQVALRYDREDAHSESNLHYAKLLEDFTAFRSRFHNNGTVDTFAEVAFAEPVVRTTISQPRSVADNLTPTTNNLSSIKSKYTKNPLPASDCVPDSKPSVLQANNFDPLVIKRIQQSSERVSKAIEDYSQKNIGPVEESRIVDNVKRTYHDTPFPSFKNNQFLDDSPVEEGQQVNLSETKPVRLSDIGVREMRVSDGNKSKPTQRQVVPEEELPEPFEQEDHTRIMPSGSQHSRVPVSAGPKPKKSLLDLLRDFSLLGPLFRQLVQRLTFLNPYTRSSFRQSVNQQGEQQHPTTSYSMYHNHSMAPWQSHLPISNRPSMSIQRVQKEYDIDYEEV